MGSLSSQRRTFLAGCTLAFTAGCLGLSESDPSVEVGNVLVANPSDEPISMTIRLDRDGATVYNGEVSLEPGAEERIERDWDAGPARYVLSYTHGDGNRIERIRLPEDMTGDPGECIDILLLETQWGTDLLLRENQPSWGAC